jgi:hypothetical protein
MQFSRTLKKLTKEFPNMKKYQELQNNGILLGLWLCEEQAFLNLCCLKFSFGQYLNTLLNGQENPIPHKEVVSLH